MSEYPEHDKLAMVKDQSQACGEFYDWLRERSYVMCNVIVDETEEYYHPVYIDIQELLAEFFGIDCNKIEKEKRTMLDDLRRLNS